MCWNRRQKKPSCSESLITNETRNKESTVYTNHKKHCYNEHNTHIHCILLNARSIVRKDYELKLLVHDENIDIIFITESRTAEHIGEAEINIPGYDLIRKDSMNKRGGGCLIYALSSSFFPLSGVRCCLQLFHRLICYSSPPSSVSCLLLPVSLLSGLLHISLYTVLPSQYWPPSSPPALLS